MSERQDNTRVNKPIIIEPIKLTPQQVREQKAREIQKKNRFYIFDKDKATYFRNMQNFYNNNAFGYGIQGRQTNYDYTTPEGQQAIQSNFDYSKGNAYDFLGNVAGAGITTSVNKVANKVRRLNRGVFKAPNKKGKIGNLINYQKQSIGDGAETAAVVPNTPNTVGKITSIPVEEMELRNVVPNSIASKYIGYVKGYGQKMPTYIQRKVRQMKPNQYSESIKRFDKSMEQQGARRLKDPNIGENSRAYEIEIDGNSYIASDFNFSNLGFDKRWIPKIFDRFRTPKAYDFSLEPVAQWQAAGYGTYKKGGKLK